MPGSAFATGQTVPGGARLLLVVIVVAAGQQVAKDHLRHVHLLLLVDLDRHAVAVVPHRDGVAGLRSSSACFAFSRPL